MKSLQLTLPAKIFLWVLSVVTVTYLYIHYRGEGFGDSVQILQKLTPSTTVENVELLFPEDQYPRDAIARNDGGQIQVIYQSPEQALKLRDESGALPAEVESCMDVPHLYAALIVSISSGGKVDGYSWDGEGAGWGTCGGR